MLATDPEAPIDLAALAADQRPRALTAGASRAHWRLVLQPGPAARTRRGRTAACYLTEEKARSQVVV